MFSVIGSFLRKAGKGTGKMLFYTKEAISDFPEKPIRNLCIILSSIACLIGVVGFIISYMLFLSQGGYNSQVAYVRDNGGMEAFDFIQRGTGTLYWKFMMVASPLLGIGFILLIICYLGSSSLIKNILIILDLLFLLGTFMLLTVFHIFLIDENILVLVFGASIIVCVLLFHFSEERYIFQHCIKSAVISFVGLPVIMWVLENIVVLTVGIVSVLMTMVVIYFIFKCFDEGSSDSSPVSLSGASKKSFSDEKKSNKNISKSQIINYDSSKVKAYVKENTWGKQVYVDNEIGMTRHICSYKEYKEGKYIIKIQGKEVKL